MSTDAGTFARYHRAMKLRPLALVLALLVPVVGCDKPKEPEPVAKAPEAAKVEPSVAPVASAAPAAKKGLVWEAPPSFHSAPSPSAMRKATYKIDKAKGDPEDAELSVIVAGGGLEANVGRWAGQFEGKPAPTRSERTVGDLKVTIVELEGTFTGGGMPGMAPVAPKPKWRLLGAIVERGDEATFFKMTGPDATVKGARKDFDALVASFKVD